MTSPEACAEIVRLLRLHVRERAELEDRIRSLRLQRAALLDYIDALRIEEARRVQQVADLRRQIRALMTGMDTAHRRAA